MLGKLINKAMELLLDGDNQVLEILRNQLIFVSTSIVKDTGVGLFVGYEVPKNIVKVESENIKKDFSFGDVYGEVGGIYGVIGFLIFVRDGYLKTLEIYPIGSEFWEQVTEDLHIGYKDELHNIEELEKSWIELTV